jgi:hypothetical protein
LRYVCSFGLLGVGLWLGVAACGDTEHGAPTGHAGSGGASGASGGASSGKASTNHAGAPDEASFGGAGGADEAHAQGGSAGATTPTDQLKRDACMRYAIAGCTRLAECNGSREQLSSCIQKILPCPEFLFGEGSTRKLEGLDACIEEHRHLSCALLPDGPSCATPGTRPPGAACVFGTECSSMVCRAQPGQCGVCATPAVTGQSCADPNVDCPTTDVCLDGVCTRAQARDPKPKLFDVGVQCTATEQCLFGLLCDTGDKARSQGVCQSVPKVGEPCRYEPGLVKPSCAGACDASGICQPLPKLGEACDQTYGCEPTAICGASLTCSRRNAEGEPCNTTVEMNVAISNGTCAPGLYCSDCVTFDQGCKCVSIDRINRPIQGCQP